MTHLRAPDDTDPFGFICHLHHQMSGSTKFFKNIVCILSIFLMKILVSNSLYFSFRGPIDTKLKKLRDSAEPPPRLELEDLIEKASHIHAAYLFADPLGHKLLRELCLWLSGTKSSNLYAGWKDFSIHIGVNPMLVEVCRN